VAGAAVVMIVEVVRLARGSGPANQRTETFDRAGDEPTGAAFR